MNDLLYPNDWANIARAIKEANEYKCQACGKQCRRPGELNLGWQYELTVAHYDNIYESEAVFVVPMCLECHLPHDSRFVWVARRRADRLRQHAAGQLEFFRQPYVSSI